MEYKIIDGQPSDVQKLLNQWKHQYNLTIIAQSVFETKKAEYPDTWVVITLIREEK